MINFYRHMSKVDVIIPTFNRAEFLESAIKSVLNQTFQDLKIIVVDDASEDNTEGVVKGFDNEKIEYIRLEAHKGEAGTRNIGIINSNAEYIAFLDDDDEWLPEKLRLQVELLDNSPPKVGGIYTGYIRVNKTNGRILGQRIPEKRGYIYKDMSFGNVIGGPSFVLLRRKCFERVGIFDENIVYGTDYDMWIRISKEFHFDYIGEPLVKYHIHENQLTNDLEIVNRGLDKMLKKYDSSVAFNKKKYSREYSSLGYQYRENGNLRKASETLMKAIKLYPFELGYYTSLCKILTIFILGKTSFLRLKNSKDRVVKLYSGRKVN